MKYKAIFFDRDGTLTMNDSGWVKLRDDKLFEWSGQPFIFSQELFDRIFKRVEYLMHHLWYLKKELYSETIEVLEYFKSRGYKMGVISDSPPSLELTLKNANIRKYFTSFTASSLVGASKPNPIIFNSEFNAQGVTAKESIYVDDFDVEADGAREQGFTSFLIDRTTENKNQWTINNLKEIQTSGHPSYHHQKIKHAFRR